MLILSCSKSFGSSKFNKLMYDDLDFHNNKSNIYNLVVLKLIRHQDPRITLSHNLSLCFRYLSVILIKYPENPRSHIVSYIIFHSDRVQYIFKVLAVLINTNISLTVHFSYTNSSFNRKSTINPPISLSIQQT